jgi:NADH-quinone oxidoreductase subunit M
VDHILSVVLLTPIAGLLVLLFIPSSQRVWIKRWANIASFLGFLTCLPLLWNFDPNKDFQFVENYRWIPSLGASFYLGIDGYSLVLVALTCLLGYIAVLSSWNAIEHRLKEYYANLLILQASMLGVFMARDFLLFFVFWELGLIPMYLIIAVWGGQRRVYSAFKFIVYTFIGSVVMFLGILALYAAHHAQFPHNPSFAIPDLLKTNLPVSTQWWIFWAFFAGFAVKVPMWPLHTWLPDAHTEAPTAGSVLLASILLKMGTYGFLRFSLPLLPDASKDSRIVNIMAVLSLIAIVYGALVCLMQKDWKKLIAYSSVSHLGFCTLGIFALNSAGIAGSMIQQINHGISTGMLFLIVGIVYERRHTREISEYGGLLRVMPVFTIIFFITALSSMGMPALNGFIGEISILKGAYQISFNWALWSAVGIALGAAYLIWLFQRTMLGELSEKNAGLRDLSLREIVVFAPLVVLAFWIGIYPKPLFRVLERPTAQIVERVRTGSAARSSPVGHFTR